MGTHVMMYGMDGKQNVQVCKSVWEVGRGKSTKRQSGKRVRILGGGGPRQGRR